MRIQDCENTVLRSNLVNLGPYPSGNNSMILNIELKMHQTNKILVGKDYVGDASVSLNIMPNGLLALASTATT